MITTHEGRLRAMIDPDTGRAWSLNDEDRAAIAWLIDAALRLKAERDEVRQEFHRYSHLANEKARRVELAIARALEEARCP